MVEYIVREAQTATRFEEQYYESCGWRGDFIRINLKAVAEGKITAEELADAFIASAVAVSEEDLAAWRAEWADIERVVAEHYPTLEGFEEDSSAIAALIADGKYVMHHSRKYNEVYSPHYRIVSKEQYEKLKDRLK